MAQALTIRPCLNLRLQLWLRLERRDMHKYIGSPYLATPLAIANLDLYLFMALHCFISVDMTEADYVSSHLVAFAFLYLCLQHVI